MSERYQPKHLNAQQAGQVYAQALQQAEAAQAQAWINLKLAEGNYRETCAQVAALESDKARALEPAP